MWLDNLRKGLRDISERMTVSLTSVEEDGAQDIVLLEDFHNLQAIADQQQCTLCNKQMLLPVSLPCGHSVCGPCWQMYSGEPDNIVNDTVMCNVCDRFYPRGMQMQPNAALCGISVILMKRGFKFNLNSINNLSTSGYNTPNRNQVNVMDSACVEDHRFSIEGHTTSDHKSNHRLALEKEKKPLERATSHNISLRLDQTTANAHNNYYNNAGKHGKAQHGPPVPYPHGGYTISKDSQLRITSTPILQGKVDDISSTHNDTFTLDRKNNKNSCNVDNVLDPHTLENENILNESDIVYIDNTHTSPSNSTATGDSNRFSFVPSFLANTQSNSFLSYNGSTDNKNKNRTNSTSMNDSEYTLTQSTVSLDKKNHSNNNSIVTTEENDATFVHTNDHMSDNHTLGNTDYHDSLSESMYSLYHQSNSTNSQHNQDNNINSVAQSVVVSTSVSSKSSDWAEIHIDDIDTST